MHIRGGLHQSHIRGSTWSTVLHIKLCLLESFHYHNPGNGLHAEYGIRRPEEVSSWYMVQSHGYQNAKDAFSSTIVTSS